MLKKDKTPRYIHKQNMCLPEYTCKILALENLCKFRCFYAEQVVSNKICDIFMLFVIKGAKEKSWSIMMCKSVLLLKIFVVPENLCYS